MPSYLCLPPELCCLGVNPTAAAISLPLRYCVPLPIVPTKAVAIKGPIPGTCCKRFAVGFSWAIIAIWWSSSFMRSSSDRRSPHKPWSNFLNWMVRPFDASSNQRGMVLRSAIRLLGATKPYSAIHWNILFWNLGIEHLEILPESSPILADLWPRVALSGVFAHNPWTRRYLRKFCREWLSRRLPLLGRLSDKFWISFGN